MKGFIDDIEDLTEYNADFRRVVYTGRKLQLVLMSIAPGEEIGEEVHPDGDQFFRVEEGKGEVWIDGVRTMVKSDFAILVPGGGAAQHPQHRQQAAEALHAVRAAAARRRHGAGDEGRCHGVGGALRGADDRAVKPRR